MFLLITYDSFTKFWNMKYVSMVKIKQKKTKYIFNRTKVWKKNELTHSCRTTLIHQRRITHTSCNCKELSMKRFYLQRRLMCHLWQMCYGVEKRDMMPLRGNLERKNNKFKLSKRLGQKKLHLTRS